MPCVAISLAIVACSVWANSAYWIESSDGYGWIPPFDPDRNRVYNHHFGAEYNSIAEALWNGRGFSDPFRDETGPTAWMPPVFPFIQLMLIKLTGNNLISMKYALVACQIMAYLVTAWLVIAAVGRTYSPSRRWIAVGVLMTLFSLEFYHAFQVTHDPWIVMLGLDILLIGQTFLENRPDRWRAAAWGAIEGITVLTGPLLGLVWFGLTWLRWPIRQRWQDWLIAGVFALLVLAPWGVRNYRTFGKIIPVKSNLFYELYQAQCTTQDGVVGNGPGRGFQTHPWRQGPERERYRALGEQRFLSEKRQIFLQAVRQNPEDFAIRIWNRFAAATVVFVPSDHLEENLPLSIWSAFPFVVHPLPFLAVVIILISPRPRTRYETAAILVYCLWLLPYIIVSYYGRYGFPLIGVKAFLCVAAIDRILSAIKSLLPPRRIKTATT